MSQETASILGNSYRIYSLKYIPYTHSTCRHLVLQGIGKVPRTHNYRKYDDTSPAFLESGPRSPAQDLEPTAVQDSLIPGSGPRLYSVYF